MLRRAAGSSRYGSFRFRRGVSLVSTEDPRCLRLPLSTRFRWSLVLSGWLTTARPGVVCRSWVRELPGGSAMSVSRACQASSPNYPGKRWPGRRTALRLRRTVGTPDRSRTDGPGGLPRGTGRGTPRAPARPRGLASPARAHPPRARLLRGPACRLQGEPCRRIWGSLPLT